MNTTTPSISILVPVYNVEKYLRECLESIRIQSFQDFEAICINDGSTDGSREIITSFLEKDRRFSVIDKPNSGYGASMNIGLNAAQGEFVTILESDDFFEPETLERLHQAITGFEAEVVRANFFLYWSDPLRKNEFRTLAPANQDGRLVNPQEERDIFDYPPAISTGMYKRDFLLRNDIRFLETPGASYQDTSWAFKVWVCATKAAFIQDAFLHYRQDNESSSVNALDKVYCVVDEYDEIERFLVSRNAPTWQYAQMVKKKLSTYLWNYDRLPDEFKLEFIQKVSSAMERDIAVGYLDWELFDRQHRKELAVILRSPTDFSTYRKLYVKGDFISRVAYSFKIGGLPLAFETIAQKLFPTKG